MTGRDQNEGEATPTGSAQGAGAAREQLIEALNRDCRCITVNQAALHRALEKDLSEAGLPSPLFESHPHLFADSPVYLSRRHVARMAEIIRAIESVVQREPYQERIREWAPSIASFDPGTKGVFFGYDFHLGPDGPQLIEINTNAGGALFNAYLARAQRACCPEITEILVGTAEPATIEDIFVEMFRSEWALHRSEEPLRTAAIVDETPADQAMYPEFVLFQQLLERAGIQTAIADPGEFEEKDDALWIGDQRIDLVYNRSCDFYLESPAHAVLRAAYLKGSAVVTPHPRAYALYADKRNLVVLSNTEALRSWGVDETSLTILRDGVPEALRVTEENADAVWADRRQFFFKPATGYGSRGAYRGAKLTRRVWKTIVAGDYVAQKLVGPSERHFTLEDGTLVLKVDLRAYTYSGEIQFLAARLYHGQTTNMRSPGGGFAPVFTESATL